MKKIFLIIAAFFMAIMTSCEQGHSVEAAEAASYIYSLTQDSKVSVKGFLTDDLLASIAKAIKEGGHKVDLDLSKTTGLPKIRAHFYRCGNLSGIIIPKGVIEISPEALNVRTLQP